MSTIKMIEDKLKRYLIEKKHSKYYLITKKYPDESFDILSNLLKTRKDLEVETLYALINIRNEKTFLLFVEEFNNTTDEDYKDALLTSIGNLGLPSSFSFLRRILPDLNDHLASVDYICIALLSENEDDLLLIINDIYNRPNFICWNNLNIAFEIFENLTIQLSSVAKYRMQQLRDRFIKNTYLNGKRLND